MKKITLACFLLFCITTYAQSAKVGELRDGGIVFWVNPEDNTHGKVCALADAPTPLNWYNAFSYCDGYTNPDSGIGVFSDWYLPSKVELRLMYVNLQRFGCSTKTPEDTDNSLCPTRKGNFAFSYYWCSTENDTDLAWVQYFHWGLQRSVNEANTTSVRAVRAF